MFPTCRFRMLAVALTAGGVGLGAGLGAELAPDEAAYFRERVEPIFEKHCYECHSHAAGKMKGGLTLDSRSGWEQGGRSGPVIIPGNPAASQLVRAIRRLDPDQAMPPRTALPEDATAALVAWVERGAPDPRVAEGTGRPGDEWWAIQPLVRPPVPEGGAAHPIDRFVEESLRSQGREWAAPAEPRVLFRRLMVDLHGVLPLPEEEEAEAEAEASGAGDEAVAAWVDRRLASPRYGERWARHWLDVAHFAETHGHDQDRPRENAWPYRDYVIRALNADKPYARFVAEQVAADALFPEEPGLTPALGFLAAGPWDESSLRDIREDTLDREIGRYLDRDDMVANVMSTFTSVTVHCARCHDHKFDPIPQRDYYALQAVFAGTEKAERLYDTDPGIHRRRQHWMRLQVALDRRDEALIESLVTPELREAQSAWERSSAARPIEWRVLETVEATAGGGVELRGQADASLLAGGDGPATNTYVVAGRSDLARITGLRLELLPDASLPAKGPGRAENGNLHLTDLRVFRASPGEVESEVALVNPSADFNQEGWEIAKAIDGDPRSGWGIHPQEGRPHVAVFEVGAGAGDVPWAGGTLRVVLRQDHGRGHTIGRFRLSVTADPPPIRVSPLPAAVEAALALVPEQRTEAHRVELRRHYLAGRVARELAELPAPERVYAGADLFPVNGGQAPLGRPREVKVLRRGEITQPLEAARPGALSCVGWLPSRFVPGPGGAGEGRGCGDVPEEARRRGDLARWLVDPGNPLVWRSIVNRVWHYHFGQGLVETPNDFGRMGGRPVCGPLLDWLAVTFRDDLGGALKGLHRLILTSRTWRQAAGDPQRAGPFQPHRQRLDAETYRDSVLRMAGRLDDTMGGPSVKQFAMSEGIHVTPKVDYAAFDVEAGAGMRRSIYRFLFRTLPDPMMDAMDSPAGDQSAPVRSESFTALQAFVLLNHPFVVHQSAHLAARLEGMVPDLPGQVRRACLTAWLREPTDGEMDEYMEHARRHGLASLCRLLLNSNEFHFVD